MLDGGENRAISATSSHFVLVGKSRSALYAARWLRRFGARLTGAASLDEARALTPAPRAILVAGDGVDAARLGDISATATPEIRIWDFEVGRSGPGAFASAVGGVSTVIGAADGPPGLMPAFIPEKWAGLLAAGLALALCFTEKNGQRILRTIDVSAADLLRAYSEQNSGNHAGVPYGWRRNGRTAVEHGGVFPQGFFPCSDGYLAVQARSRQDWQNILSALGNPTWAADKKFQNPFTLSLDDGEVSRLLDCELKKHTRREWLDKALQTGAPMAPVFNLEEARLAHVFRAGFTDLEGAVNAPFIVRRV